MEIAVMEMRSFHLEDCAKIEGACFSLPWSREMLAGEQNNPLSHCFVAARGLSALGYGCFLAVEGEGEILKLAVAPEERRRGAGSKILEKMLEKARDLGLSRLTLEVRESNLSAIALYQKHGFLPIAKRRGYYIDPMEDALIMELIL